MAGTRFNAAARRALGRTSGVSGRAVWRGVLAAVGLLGFYLAVLSAASGVMHLQAPLALDWPWITAIVGGWRLRRADGPADHFAEAAAGAGGGSRREYRRRCFGDGDAACCAHHVAEIAPVVSVNVAATFRATYRVPFMAVGVAVNAVTIAITVRRLGEEGRHVAHGLEHPQCAV
ncbi:MAG TPA: hypothetical protein VK887_05855 [Pseudonocardiaceae bacterium]|nr:hypothetical protein [Pseudonocardiaceae bacterium]